MGLIVKLVLVLAIVAGGAWGWMMMHPSAPATAPAQDQVQTYNSAPGAQAPVTSDNSNSGISAGTATDASLNSDLNSFDTEAQSAQSDSTSVDSSFNDQPVQQTE